jgi:hypothetical protein
VAVVPEWDVKPVEAFATAIDALLPAPREHPCDVRFGRDVVRVLFDAEQQLA